MAETKQTVKTNGLLLGNPANWQPEPEDKPNNREPMAEEGPENRRRRLYVENYNRIYRRDKLITPQSIADIITPPPIKKILRDPREFLLENPGNPDNVSWIAALYNQSYRVTPTDIVKCMHDIQYLQAYLEFSRGRPIQQLLDQIEEDHPLRFQVEYIQEVHSQCTIFQMSKMVTESRKPTNATEGKIPLNATELVKEILKTKSLLYTKEIEGQYCKSCGFKAHRHPDVIGPCEKTTSKLFTDTKTCAENELRNEDGTPKNIDSFCTICLRYGHNADVYQCITNTKANLYLFTYIRLAQEDFSDIIETAIRKGHITAQRLCKWCKLYGHETESCYTIYHRTEDLEDEDIEAEDILKDLTLDGVEYTEECVRQKAKGGLQKPYEGRLKSTKAIRVLLKKIANALFPSDLYSRQLEAKQRGKAFSALGLRPENRNQKQNKTQDNTKIINGNKTSARKAARERDNIQKNKKSMERTQDNLPNKTARRNSTTTVRGNNQRGRQNRRGRTNSATRKGSRQRSTSARSFRGRTRGRGGKY